MTFGSRDINLLVGSEDTSEALSLHSTGNCVCVG